ncbi:hypothetical protein EDB92DRAFT_1640746 [Lactarius akahatsu]|uniref:Uncharacterized protein n=1 Tax=Lactarius akahatsu TaxID=416441 RepID=A0AAD4Q9G2_9AGAM|nr:hypothetical protein EDB92DRAFT_1640746 [Lactarius akahatsu]
MTNAVRIAWALGPKSFIFGLFGLGPVSRGLAAISVSHSHGVAPRHRSPHLPRRFLSLALSRASIVHPHSVLVTHGLSSEVVKPLRPRRSLRFRHNLSLARARPHLFFYKYGPFVM